MPPLPRDPAVSSSCPACRSSELPNFIASTKFFACLDLSESQELLEQAYVITVQPNETLFEVENSWTGIWHLGNSLHCTIVPAVHSAVGSAFLACCSICQLKDWTVRVGCPRQLVDEADCWFGVADFALLAWPCC